MCTNMCKFRVCCLGEPKDSEDVDTGSGDGEGAVKHGKNGRGGSLV